MQRDEARHTLFPQFHKIHLPYFGPYNCGSYKKVASYESEMTVHQDLNCDLASKSKYEIHL